MELSLKNDFCWKSLVENVNTWLVSIDQNPAIFIRGRRKVIIGKKYGQRQNEAVFSKKTNKITKKLINNKVVKISGLTGRKLLKNKRTKINK